MRWHGGHIPGIYHCPQTTGRKSIASNTITISRHNILTDYHSMTDDEVDTVSLNRTDDGAIQNSSTLFKCLESSVTGDLKATIFTQSGNLPENEDRIKLFKLLTSFTTTASLQLSMISFNNILHFNSALHKFSIPTIKSKLINLVMLATTNTREFLDAEKIQHTINVYNKIKQPEIWAQWVRNQVDQFEEVKVAVCQTFMNKVLVKYNRIIGDGEHGDAFHGSTNTLQQDIVAMLFKGSTEKGKKKTPPKKTPGKDNDEESTPKAREFPPFAKWFKSPTSEGYVEYKAGDTKDYNGKPWHYCDAPNHRNRIKWHTHATSECHTRSSWLKTDEGAAATANIAPVTVIFEDTASAAERAVLSDSTSSNPSNVTTLLASALNMVGDNDNIKDLIAKAINTAASM